MLDGREHGGTITAVGRHLHEARAVYARVFTADNNSGPKHISPGQCDGIPKPGGGERPLGIPTIRDRVAQTAAKLVLEPIFEADLEPTAYGYRPGRSGIDAVKAVHQKIEAIAV